MRRGNGSPRIGRSDIGPTNSKVADIEAITSNSFHIPLIIRVDESLLRSKFSRALIAIERPKFREVHGVAATRARHQLIHTHNGYAGNFGHAGPSPPRAVFRT